jgi:hypothetical protein
MPRQPNSGNAPEGVELRDISRLVRKLRRKVYRETPVASANRTAELDHRMSYLDMTTALGAAKLGVPSRGAALALWRACNDRGLRAWCYEFGFPESLTQAVTVVDVDGVLEVHDAFFNSSYRPGLSDLLTSLRDGRAVNGKDGIRDRKIYIMDPASEAQATVCWFEAHADRELEPVDGLRRFQVLWNPEAFAATYPAIDVVSRGLAARGYPEELQFLKLHPVAMFDGARWHRDHADMPLLGGQDLTSPVAALRVATRDLATERARVAETAVRITRVEADLADVNSRLSAASHQFAAERETWLQQKVALQAGKSALEGELKEMRTRFSAAVDLRARRDSQIAQLRAEIEDTTQQYDRQRSALVAFESLQREWEDARLRLETENCDLRTQLAAGARANEQVREFALAWERRARSADEHAIEISHCVAPLIEQVSRLRGERDAISRDKARLEAQIAASPGARLKSLWRRLVKRPEPS